MLPERFNLHSLNFLIQVVSPILLLDIYIVLSVIKRQLFGLFLNALLGVDHMENLV